MRLAVIGTGYVGLVTGACFAEFGNEVVCVDLDRDKIMGLRRGQIPFFEPGLEEVVLRNLRSGRLSFSTDTQEAVTRSSVIFLAVQTPSRPDGLTDLSFVEQVARTIGSCLNGYKVLVTKSTVPVKTAEELRKRVEEARSAAGLDQVDFSVASNPEFLREGSAVEDFMRPDRIVVGTDDDAAAAILRELYAPLSLTRVPFVQTSIETAELIKYASNAFLATKITFINEIANLCEQVGADVHDVSRAMGLDGRIGPKFLHPGAGYGGSCFPKDTESLVAFSREFGVEQRIVAAVCEANRAQRERAVEKIAGMTDGLEGRTIGVLGLSYKPNTDDVRESPSIHVIRGLQQGGARIRCFDPQALENARTELSDVHFCRDAYEVAENASALVLATEWNEFRALDLGRIKKLLAEPVIVDLRNIYEPSEMARLGFRYVGVGR
ncbi:MAG: UDP-glucose/GDP-mannose dehydrogenase family protein [Myxococcales bacterium]|nr:UDP-glucose/GDP-mannose dehydrogenase family protein [Myxococcales bacterium]